MACLRDANSEAATGACVARLDPKVHARLLTVHDLAKSIDTLRKTPAKIDCTKVAEHHYSDARVKAELGKMKPADRKLLVTGIRQTMSGACANEAWDESTRACMVADGGEETCFGTMRWGAVQATPLQLYAIPACADYAKAVADFQQCTTAPRETRTAMQQALQQIEQASVTVSASQKATLDTACRAAANAVRQVQTTYGC